MFIFRQNIFGIATISAIVILSVLLSKFLSSSNLLISSAFLCIFTGLILGNFFSINENTLPFISFCLKKLLIIGIAILGLSLSLTELLDYGSTAIILVLLNIIIAFLIIMFLCKMFNIPSNLGYLITMGTCICGVTAVIATSSIIKSNKDETSYAVGIVTLFGILAYNKNSNIKFLFIYLIFISIILELVHIVIPVRAFQIADLFGNFIGVIFVISIYFIKNEFF